ncbi:hypothetical protein A5722_31015 [Mycobacterium vulneris]|nr:hypothetical protein A5721_30470 [Mycolicibacterium vulneris]OCB51639.1 hypothetical protein A5722_31015 [Mycolicibacterium vulneris]OCB64577.1 hypothetical protein A5729_19970 [Mycolicibacterium vulneris]
MRRGPRMTARLALSLSAATAMGFALGSLALGTPTMFGISLAISMVLVIAADLARFLPGVQR